jgi:(1->4)-alpha-D-glucan 1-alpha-D-glucosylmutase
MSFTRAGSWRKNYLTPPEKLPSDWPIDGTTGYDMLNLVGGLFIDPNGKQGMTRIYEEFTGGHMNMTALVRECKHLVITELLGSELNRLTSLFVAVCERTGDQEITEH